MNDKCTAIVLSAGKGKRMGTDRAKQYLDLCGKPVLYYSLRAFQDSFVDEMIIVASKEDFDYLKDEIVDKYGITKVTKIVEGGAERYDSVLCGLRAVAGGGYVFIHDGARPFVDDDILTRAFETVEKYGTAIVSVPSKDTVKIVDDEGITVDTPDRKSVWLMQTPQVFSYEPILEAYERMSRYEEEILTDFSDVSKPTALIPLRGMSGITDDAMVMEKFGTLSVHVSQGSYRNIKITTPEDMLIAEAFIKDMRKR